jgi:hypothetical protein
MSETSNVSSPTPTKRTSLKEFINDNDKLFTAIGVMGALAALFTTLKNGQYIAFLSFAMLLVLNVELMINLHKTKGMSETLIIFQVFFESFIAAIAVFIFVTYPSYFPLLISAPVGIFIAWFIIRVYRMRRSKN